MRVLDALALERGDYPKRIIVDNGPEFTGRALDQWVYEHGVELHFITPGKPTQPAYIESFNGRFRDECLNQHWFTTLRDARHEIERWRLDYNQVRPHSALGRIPPARFVAQLPADGAPVETARRDSPDGSSSPGLSQ